MLVIALVVLSIIGVCITDLIVSFKRGEKEGFNKAVEIMEQTGVVEKDLYELLLATTYICEGCGTCWAFNEGNAEHIAGTLYANLPQVIEKK